MIHIDIIALRQIIAALKGLNVSGYDSMEALVDLVKMLSSVLANAEQAEQMAKAAQAKAQAEAQAKAEEAKGDAE